MSASAEPTPSEDRAALHEVPGDAAAIDALPVLAPQARVLSAQAAIGALADERRSGALMTPAVQAAAVAAGGFVAGAALVGLVSRRRRRPAARAARGRRRGADARRRGRRSAAASELVQIVGSRSLLVDVHLLGGPDGR